jgi:hypothetical protein
MRRFDAMEPSMRLVPTASKLRLAGLTTLALRANSIGGQLPFGRAGLGVMTRNLLILATAIAGLAAIPTAASAATDGTSNTIVFAELRHTPTGFIDFTDDVCLLRATKCGVR